MTIAQDHGERIVRLSTREGRSAARSPAPVVALEVLPRPENVGLVRQLVRRLASFVSGLEGSRIDEFVVAVSEACTNAVEAHLAAASHLPVRVEVRSAAGRFGVTVLDRGGGFDPAAIPARPPQHDPAHLTIERGWGIQLMRSLVDELRFSRRPDGMAIELVVLTVAAEHALR